MAQVSTRPASAPIRGLVVSFAKIPLSRLPAAASRLLPIMVIPCQEKRQAAQQHQYIGDIHPVPPFLLFFSFLLHFILSHMTEPPQ